MPNTDSDDNRNWRDANDDDDAFATVDELNDVDGNDVADYLEAAKVAEITVLKTSAVISDPINLSTNPKRIPGATLRFTLTIENIGAGAAENSVMTDPVDSTLSYRSGSVTATRNGTADAGIAETASYAAATRQFSVDLGVMDAGDVVIVTYEVEVD